MIHIRTLVAGAVLAGVTSLASATGYTGLYILGDSLSDAGNVAELAGSNPGQVISGNGYIPNLPYALGQYTNADVWAKSFASGLGLASGGLPSLLGGGNFAFGGARTATDGAGLTPSLKAQANQFLFSTGGMAPSGALYVVAGGGNDARDALTAAATAAAMAADPTPVIAAAAANYAQQTGLIIDQLQAAGATNFIVWNVPNLALAPAVTVQGDGATFLGGLVSQAMNGALAARLSTETGIKLYDLYGFQNTWSASPATYGVTNVADACGALAACNPSTYLYWDGIHPTSAGHALVARSMLVTAVPEPQTWALLIGGLLFVGLRARRRA